MITPNTFRLETPDGNQLLALAPFGVGELETVMPIDTTGMLMAEQHLASLAASSAGQLAARVDQNQHNVAWGMYEPEPSRDSFLGVITLSEFNTGTADKPEFTRLKQDIGTLIMRKNARGRGVGSLAKLVVIERQLASSETQIIQATTTERNVPAQKSLHKLGFEHISSWTDGTFNSAGQYQRWRLIRQEAIDRVAKSDAYKQRLIASWQRYLNFRGDMRVIEEV
jgi:RimJ/RimL family protein N-acetyltransferase